jgi:hypothetical protein
VIENLRLQIDQPLVLRNAQDTVVTDGQLVRRFINLGRLREKSFGITDADF